MRDVEPPGSETTPAQARPADVLVPRRALFGNPHRTAAAVSPDGRRLAFLAPFEGVLNVWVSPLDAPDAAQPLTRASGRPVADFVWAAGSDRILFRHDQGGTENFSLYGASLADGTVVDYTPMPDTQANIIRVSSKVPERVLIGLNDRDRRWHDVYSLDLQSGELTPVWRNPGGYQRVLASPELELVLARRILPGGGAGYERFQPDGSLVPVFDFGLEDSWTTTALSAASATRVHLLDTRGRNTAALSALDLETGELTVIAEDDRVDVGGSIKDPRTGAVIAYSLDVLTRRWIGLDPATAADIARIDEAVGGPWALTAQSDDNRFWTLSVERVAAPTSFWLYDREGHEVRRLFSSRPDLDEVPLAPMHGREIASRDGLTLVSYLSLPPGADADGDGVPDHPLPMILLVHGGPWGRDTFFFEPYHQWLANRGYAVLSVNFRGSTGFGKAFLNAGNLEWGRKMQDDLHDAVAWAVQSGVTGADAVCIMGGSYGGYAALVGVAMTPDAFRCGVEIVGVSNLITFMETVPPYWGAIYEQFAHRMGDPRTEAGRAMLRERSPALFTHRIKVPLLIGQGANDARVNKRESDQVVDSMRAAGAPVTYVLYPDEGHGFRRPENALSFNAVTEGFLASCLGGACEPIGEDFRGSSIQVLEGATLVEGLAQALGAPAADPPASALAAEA
jgi:dipeptidyl aminopeptidase/acylaminoacyl peptidase